MPNTVELREQAIRTLRDAAASGFLRGQLTAKQAEELVNEANRLAALPRA